MFSFTSMHLVIVNERVIANNVLELLQLTNQIIATTYLNDYNQMLQINAIATNILYQ
jgi:hypothetical protein